MPEPIRVLLVDAPTLIRRSLAALLARRRRLQVVGEAATGAQAVVQAPSVRPDVIVVDPEVPDGGIKLVGDLVQARPGCGILVLTRSTDGSGVGHALQAGARGYLQKDCEPEALFEAIERVHRGELVVAPALREAVVQDLGTGPSRRSGPASLTLREIEVLRLVAQGHTNQEMARELVITQHTVKAHLAKMLGKLGLDNRVQLAAYATQHGIASPNNYPA